MPPALSSMTLTFQALLMMVLLVCGAVAYLPVVLLQPEPHRSPPLRSGLKNPGLWLVENPEGQWFLNGALQSQLDVQRLVRSQAQKQVIHYLPSDALPLETVSRSLRTLRTMASGSVVLELPPATDPSQ